MRWPLELLLGGAAALVLALGLAVTYAVVTARHERRQAVKTQARLAGLMANLDPLARAGDLPKSLLRDEAPSHSLLDQYLSGTALATRLTHLVERAQSTWTPGHVLGLSLAAGFGGLVAGSVVDPLLGVITGGVGLLLPAGWLQRQATRRQRAIEAQLPDTVDLLANALKAGYSLQAAMQFVGEETAAPLGPELQRFSDEQRLGLDVRHALLDLARRLDSADTRLLILAILIQRETGGNLSEILRTLASVVRERLAFRNNVEVLTAESRLSGRVLSGLPLLLFAALALVNPGYLQPLLDSGLGRLALMYGAVSLCIGLVLMHRFSRITV